MAQPQVVKQYEVVSTSALTRRHHTISHNGNAILNCKLQSGFFQTPQINILSNDDQTIFAACRLRSLLNDMRILLGNPDCVAKEDWTILDRDSFSTARYHFTFNGRRFGWTRTHNEQLGGTWRKSTDFKLVDESDGKVLAVWVTQSRLLAAGSARIDYFVELGRDLELLSLAAIMGVEEQIRRRKNSAAASSAGGGA